MRRFSAMLSLLLVSSLAVPAETAEGNLRLMVVSGDGAVNNVRSKLVTPVAVEVRDERNRPVEGARVRFTLPALGAGGRFADGARTSEVISDARGRASIDSFVPNDHEGRFTLVVEAVSKGRDATTSVSQMNSRYVVPAPSSGVEMQSASSDEMPMDAKTTVINKNRVDTFKLLNINGTPSANMIELMPAGRGSPTHHAGLDNTQTRSVSQYWCGFHATRPGNPVSMWVLAMLFLRRIKDWGLYRALLLRTNINRRQCVIDNIKYIIFHQ